MTGQRTVSLEAETRPGRNEHERIGGDIVAHETAERCAPTSQGRELVGMTERMPTHLPIRTSLAESPAPHQRTTSCVERD